MNNEITIRIYDVVDSSICVASDDAQRLYEQIKAALDQDYSVLLSFQNVENLITAFLNTAIGQLYGSFTEDKIRAKLRVVDIQPDHLQMLKRVVDTAKEYFKDPQRFKNAVREVLGDDVIII